MDMEMLLDGSSKLVAGASVLTLMLGAYVRWRGLDKVSTVLRVADKVLSVLALNLRRK